MIETSFPKVKIGWEDGVFYCPYIPDIFLKSNYSWLDEVKENEVEE
jgi:hypothetical protein